MILKRFNDDVAARGWDVVTRDCLPIALVERKLAGEHPLRIWREQRGLSGAALAKLSGVPQSYISDIGTGKKPGSIGAFGKLATALGLKIDDLAAIGVVET